MATSKIRERGRIILALACLIALSGCSPPLKIVYRDPGPLATPWEGRKPKIHLGAINDETGGVLLQQGILTKLFQIGRAHV